MITYSGVDWLTMTSDHKGVGEAWWTIFKNYSKTVKEGEPPPEDFHNGYYAGRKIAGLRWGCSENLGFILIASGNTANEIWQKAYAPAHTVTRVDLCFDLQVEVPQELAKNSYEIIKAGNNNIKRKYGLFETNQGGSTFYVGSRHSQQFGRLYDKGVQSRTQERGRLWRYEVEYKKPLADVVMEAFSEKGPDNRAVAIVDTVADWFRNRGTLVPFTTEDKHIMTITTQKRVTTYNRKIAWLRTQVRPTVKMLVEAGLGKEVIDCLLLPVDDRTKTQELPTC